MTIERAHRVGHPNSSNKRTIVAKFASYKTKEHILMEAKKLKGTNIFIYEDFSKDTMKIRKEKWEQIKILRKQGKFATLIYDRIYTREHK